MSSSDLSERGLEISIFGWLTERNGYVAGSKENFDKEFALDQTFLFPFLKASQPEKFSQLGLENDTKKQKQFLHRLQSEITKRGIVDVLRKGVNVYPAGNIKLFNLTPSEANLAAQRNFEKNIFSVTRQVHYSLINPKLSIDLCIFINGLPLITFELKNQITKQNVEDAVRQYQIDRSPNELLFQFKRCMVHFAVDDNRAKFCTKLEGKSSWFLPFDKGYRDGSGNPPNPSGLKTDYLWKDILTKSKLSTIIEKYAQVVTEEDPTTHKKTVKQIFPRYHQLDCVEKLLCEVKKEGLGGRFLIQHSAGSGKSNSITWLAYQLASLENNKRPFFDSVLVVTDRRILDRQIRDNIQQFKQLSNTVIWANTSETLKKAISQGKRLIITTVEKFPYVVSKVDDLCKDKKFAIIIDEAHSGQNGRNSSQMNIALSGGLQDPDKDTEDKINELMEGRKLLRNACYFAFTATPKNKTLEAFGTQYRDDDGTKFKPFHVYTMKQAIQEGFIMDVLQNYTPISSYYKLKKVIQDDPLFDKNRANKKLRAFVESSPTTIAQKAELIVRHFHDQVLSKGKIGGLARGMVVTSSIERCVEYYKAINNSLAKRKSPYKAIIAFSEEYRPSFNDPPITSSGLNGFPDSIIPATFKTDPYRLLVVADMFQTGFDEPLLHSLYVDKQLYDIRAVQTLSRLNRAHPKKRDTFVLDFYNEPEVIEAAFSKYYKTTILSGETDPNKLYDLIATLEEYRVFTDEQVCSFVDLYLEGAERSELDPILDSCAEIYKTLNEDDQINFKSTSKAFCRTYGFLGAILPFGNADWERLSIFLNFLNGKLPTPKDEDLAEGILETVDLDSYRLEARETMSIILKDEDSEILPVPTGGGGHYSDPKMELLSSILEQFNSLFGNIEWKDADSIRKQILAIPEKVAQDERYKNAILNSDRENAKIESERALLSVILASMTDNIELFKQYQDNPSFKQWLTDYVFRSTYTPPKAI